MDDQQQRNEAFGYAINDFAKVHSDLSQRLRAIEANLPKFLEGFRRNPEVTAKILPFIGLVLENWDKIRPIIDPLPPTGDGPCQEKP